VGLVLSKLRSISLTQAIAYVLVIYGAVSCLSVRLLDMALFLAWLLTIRWGWQTRHEDREPLPLVMKINLLFVASSLLSSTVSQDIVESLYRTWAIFFDASLFWLGWRFLRDPSMYRRTLWAVLLSLGVSSAVAILQWLQGVSRPGGATSDLTMFTLAGLLLIIIPYLFSETFLSTEEGGFRFKQETGIILIVIAFAALVFNATRIAWIVSIGVFGAYLSTAMPKRSRIMAGTLVVLVLLGFWGFAQTNNAMKHNVESLISLPTQRDSSLHYERIYKWESAWNMFLDHPIIGVGPGRFKYEYLDKYILPMARERTAAHAHNNFLQVLAENGVIGFLIFLGLFSHIVIKAAIGCRDPIHRPVALAVLVSTMALLAMGMTEYYYENFVVMRVFWLLTGMAWYRLSQRSGQA